LSDADQPYTATGAMATRANVPNHRIARIGPIELAAVFADDPLRVRCVAESRGMLSP